LQLHLDSAAKGFIANACDWVTPNTPGPLPDFGFALTYLPIIETVFGLVMNVLVAVMIERSALMMSLSLQPIPSLRHIVNCSSVVIGPYLAIRSSEVNYSIALALTMCGLTLCMKLTGYAMTNTTYRKIYFAKRVQQKYNNLKAKRKSKSKSKSNKNKTPISQKTKKTKKKKCQPSKLD
jgi:hypothetical protein